MTDQHWQPGDRLIHSLRPEWGTGLVLAATSIRQDGKDAQRLSIRFDRAGTKNISTAVATLVAPGSVPVGASRAAAGPDTPAAPNRTELLQALREIPDAASDPFRPLVTRLEATAALYRFEPSGKLLLDWAAAQTGLADPLSVFSRSDLEEAFARFRTLLDEHLRGLVRLARREEPAALSGLGTRVTPAVRDMLTRMLTER
ncbi:MAG: DUF3553 domain-containing protein [Planctomycetota bacterium]|nr:MAG: DUF3553 domain-containing protein [Planctomycetota bacterium]